MADAASAIMRTVIAIACLGLCGCIKPDDDCGGAAQSVTDAKVLTAASGQAYLATAAASKDCHARFSAYLAYTGADALDPDLPTPDVSVSANAVGTGGEQPGLIGILLDWRPTQDDTTGELGWYAELDGAAKNVDAPAVFYGMAAMLGPGEARPVAYEATIEYLLPPVEPSARAAVAGAGAAASARCR